MGVRDLCVLVFKRRGRKEQDGWLSPTLTEKSNIKDDSTRMFRKTAFTCPTSSISGQSKTKHVVRWKDPARVGHQEFQKGQQGLSEFSSKHAKVRLDHEQKDWGWLDDGETQ